MRERDILYEAGDYWICKLNQLYVVFQNGVTHATSIAHFPGDPDGWSLAVAYANYKAGIGTYPKVRTA